MTDIQHYEDRVYTTVEVCKILEFGIDRGGLAAWPNVTLPEYAIAVARACAAEADPLELEELKAAASRPINRHSFQHSDCLGALPRFPPSRLVRRLPATRGGTLTFLRMTAGVEQP